MLKRLVLILAIFSSLSLKAIDSNDSVTQPELCGAEQTQCAPESCFKQCLDEGEDPLECPYYCYDHV